MSQSLLIGEPSKTDAFVTDLHMIVSGEGKGKQGGRGSTAVTTAETKLRKNPKKQIMRRQGRDSSKITMSKKP
jgi:hypothetical protein